jgi:maltooligosyltrehalose trehalohydrolase
VWAPARKRVELIVLDEGEAAYELQAERGGYFSACVPEIRAGTRYRFRLDGGASFPDPASRFQPEGPHGPSEVVDPAAFDWTDDKWRGASIVGQVIYELHVGTFSDAGTFRGAIEHLPQLAEVGITVIEIMPLADFPGRFGWGYDGVNLFAPSRLYGTPDDLRALVDAAHRTGIAVILDVVYNHFGPDGNYLREFSPRYFSARPTEWGDAIHFHGADAGPVREFFIANAAYWIEEFHLDGLRLDATQSIFDDSRPEPLAVIAPRGRRAARGRATMLIAENEPQRTDLVRPREAGGCGLDALWNDDFHHAARVAVTGGNEAYYSGYTGAPQELISAAKYGYLYQGQWFSWQHQRRGSPALDLPPSAFINFIANHDQIANSSAGERLNALTSPAKLRALTALLLLLPQTPMLFQGQEFAASAPFLYFADHNAELAKLVREGRRTFFEQFPSLATPEGKARLDDPAAPSTFMRCKIDWSERTKHGSALALHADLLRLRRDDPVLAASRAARIVDGAVLGDNAFALRYFSGPHGDRLLVVNLGRRLHIEPAAEPLLAPPRGTAWAAVLSTEDPRYGGGGTPPVDSDGEGWWLPADSAVFLTRAAK